MKDTKERGKIARSDIEAKMRQIQGEVDDATATAKPAGAALGVAIVAGALGIAYTVGQRKSSKMTTVVEVRRVGK